jgi:ABC-type multidrug transport system fused ATPase/permease subunit
MKYLPRVFRYFLPHWKLGVCSAALILLGGLVGLLSPWPMKILIDNALGKVPLPRFWSVLLGAFARQPFALLVFAVTAKLGLGVAENMLSVVDNYVNTRLEQNMALDFRTVLFEHVQRLSMSYHDRRRSSMLIYVINGQGGAVAHLIMTVPSLASSVLTLVGMFWISLQMDWQLALLSLTVVPFLYSSVGYYSKHIQEKVVEVAGMEANSLAIVHEVISMIRVIIAFGREPHELRRFRTQGERNVDQRVKLTLQQTLFSLTIDTVTATGTTLVLGVGAYHVLKGWLTIGQLLVIMSYIASVYKPLESLSTTAGSLQEIFVSLRMAFELLDSEPEIRDNPGAIDIERAEGRVTFENVSFHYEGREDTLQNISFDVPAGQVVAIVGATGAGKTTLISQLPRFYDANEGRILLDGIDIRNLSLKSLRKQISSVLQDPLLFSATVAENIRYGRLDASMDEVIAAAQDANAHDFIMRLPKQYETELGERGARLSTGERQRICVARAFLKDAPILILDEPTSSIDSKTEAVILDALDRLMMGRTTFMIAHRLSTIRYADLILVVDRGRLVEQGTHDELMKLHGLYYQLYDVQMARRKSKRIPVLSSELAEEQV